MKLYLKHLAATSRLAGAAAAASRAVDSLRLLSTPELGLVHAEHAMMDQLLREMIKPDFNCIDIGAHIGSKTRQMVDLAPAGRHFAVEASPQKSRWLEKRFPQVRVFNKALSDAPGEVTFYENLSKPGFSSLIAPKPGQRSAIRQVTVEAATLDALIPQDARIDFIKIDIEGGEYDALRGAARILGADRPVILFEAGGAATREPQDKSDDESGGHSGGDRDGHRVDNGAARGTPGDVFRLLHEEYGYDIYPVFHVAHRRGPIDLKQFHDYRVYPFLSFNYFALQRAAA